MDHGPSMVTLIFVDFPLKKRECSTRNSVMREFSDCIEDMDLINLQLCGGSWEEDGSRATIKERWRMIPTCIWWSVWRERNDRCFENRKNNLQEVKLKYIYSNESEPIIDV
ncbi:hypothetical protein H5410_046039 [Solanum commersonii]|uniref:Uncharacterized protein n=1 Tax=Solanum commersonii TaxID=4109 RepID=A0A9J5XD96_SOLCO|nr:hypothetical protein H5410_046039 [Solanum commersonii]